MRSTASPSASRSTPPRSGRVEADPRRGAVTASTAGSARLTCRGAAAPSATRERDRRLVLARGCLGRVVGPGVRVVVTVIVLFTWPCTTVLIPQNIFFAAALSFLGVGSRPTPPRGGSLLYEA
jgi:hypothetical protein